MKSASGALTAHLAQGQTTLTTCLTVNRTDGIVMGFTELDQDIVFNGVTYVSASGFSRFNLQDKENLDTSTVQLDGMLDNVVTRDDVVARRYDFADVEVFLVNWVDLSAGKLILKTGRFGPVTLKEFSFSVELRWMSYQTTAIGGELCSPICRVDLGSPRCGFNVSAIMQTGTIVSTDGFKNITVSGVAVGAFPLDGGLITWTGGANVNLSDEVNTFVSGVISLKLDSLLAITPGDTFKIQPGCDKTMNTCVTVFANGVNFQAEPYIPGFDHMLNYPNYQPPHK
jgi:uncharacterized phage protein (TIGR02218 family)